MKNLSRKAKLLIVAVTIIPCLFVVLVVATLIFSGGKYIFYPTFTHFEVSHPDGKGGKIDGLKDLAHKKYLDYKYSFKEQNKKDRDKLIQEALELQEKAYSTADERVKFWLLDHLAEYAYLAGDLEKAKKYGQESIDTAETQTAKDNAFGGMASNFIHNSHVTLGRVALKQGNREEAKKQLLESVNLDHIKNAQLLQMNLDLARELYEIGEKETVLEYLRKLEKYWKMDLGKRKLLIERLVNGQTPDWKS